MDRDMLTLLYHVRSVIERMKTEGIPNPLSCFKDAPIKNLSMLDIANIYSDKRRFSDASKLEEKEANVEAV